MKSKHLLLTLLLAFALPWAAMAQGTLTVCQGDEEEQHIPIYAYSGDTQGTTSEFVIPASNLTALNGKEVTALKFYLSQSQSKTWTAVYQVYMAEVEYTTLSETIGPDEGTIVYEGTVDASGSELTITFNQGNYTYNGGNLLIGTYVATAGAWDSNGKFYGIVASEAAYLSGSWGGYDDGPVNFIPQTTFTYLTDDPYITLAPTSATVLTGFTTTLTATYGNVTGTPTITYTSSNEGVAKVVGDGTTATVTGMAPGTATITATLNGAASATCAITVEEPSYCTPHYSQTSDYIESFVTTGGDTNISNTNTGQGTGGYSDFYNSHYASISEGEALSFTVTRGYDDSYKYAIWVDWNHDYVFDVNTETVVQQTTSVRSDWSSSFTIPAGTTAGDYRMRVEMLYGSSNTLNPCVSATYGEVEDYKLTVLASNPCGKPDELTANGEPTYTEFSFTIVGGSGLYNIFTKAGDGDWTNWEYEWEETTVNLTGLTPETDYEVRVQSVCTDMTDPETGDAVTSNWTTLSFTTPEACAVPTNLAESNITTNSATLSWNGTSNSYVLQYRPWQQVGEDHLSTGEFVTYTYDLSEFKGQGSIAIRHYDVTDVFYLNVDNVELKADDESTIFFEDFESGSIPSTWTNYDVDGDGYTWDMAQTGSMNVIGNYGVYSASWLSGVGALHPDNWLIIPNVELGGTFSFEARGQDPNYPAENFAVYVSMESDITEVAVNGTSYNAENLTPATPYAWQVKGDCGEYQSNWVTSLFNTKDDAFIFATNGDWDDLDNWTDAEGNPISELPTVERKVRVNAEAIIPAGVVATSGKTTIGEDGSITIKDGGELKHNTATLWVIMEKDITAWTIGETIDENNKSNGWYFISTPFSGTTEIEQNGAWSHVNNLAADSDPEVYSYDLYGFDPTEDQEWINYRENPTHAVFTAGNNYGLVFKKGYLYASNEDRTVTFEGTISKSVNNPMTETFEYDGTSTNLLNGWALVGNPYSCSAYINYVDGENVLEANFYVMNAAGDGYELSESSVALPPLTGAFVNYSATGTVNFSTEAPETPVTSMLNMTVSNGRSSVDMARVRFGRGHNLKHMSFRQNSSKLYIPQDNDYAVVYSEENQGEMPVSFKAEKNGTYTLGFNTKNVEFSYLHLIDNMTGADVDLLATPSYSFEAKTTDYASRFKLVFATGNNTEDNFAFMSNGNLIVSNEGEATLQVIDVNGRILRNESINGSTSVSMNNTPGVYMLRLINGNDVKIQKIVVK